MKFLKARLKVEYSFTLYLLAMVMLGQYKMLELYMVSLACHEIGHIIALKIKKINIKAMTIYPYGGVLEIDNKKNSSCLDDIFIYICGPLCNLILLIISILIGNHTLGYINFLLMAINLLPAYPLDGFYILSNIFSYKMSYRLSLFFSRLIGIIMLTIAIILMITRSLYFLILVLFLLIINIKNLKNKKELKLFLLDKYLNPNPLLKNKEIKADLSIDKTFFKGKNNYIRMNERIYSERQLLENIYYK